MSANNTLKLLGRRMVAQKSFEQSSLIGFELNNIKLSHPDSNNFVVEVNSQKLYFGRLEYALVKMYRLLHLDITNDFKVFAHRYSNIKPSMNCNEVDIDEIKKYLKRI